MELTENKQKGDKKKESRKIEFQKKNGVLDPSGKYKYEK